MRKWQVSLGTMLAFVTLASAPLSAMAQGGEDAAADAKRPLKGSLAIVAPRVVAVGHEMSLGVFQRENQEPVPGAGVWAFTRDGADALKQETDALRERIANAGDADYEELFGGRGHFLGRTGGDGRLFHTFADIGDHVLVAARQGYVPDFSPIAVRGAKANGLIVSAPRVSAPGESVSISVTDKADGQPVKDAGVWAMTRESAEALRTEVPGIRPTDDSGVDVESMLNGRGLFLGTTHGNGELKYTFESEGVYVLVAFKRGYLPGYTGIAIKNAPKALAVEAPRTLPADESATISVSERRSGDKVKDAGIWALTPAEAEQLKTRLAEVKPADSTTIDLESVIGGFGVFLGRTNGNGELRHTFDRAGRYVLVALKTGYIPGYAGMAVIAPKPATTANPAGRPALAPNAVERPQPRAGAGDNATNTDILRRANNT